MNCPEVLAQNTKKSADRFLDSGPGPGSISTRNSPQEISKSEDTCYSFHHTATIQMHAEHKDTMKTTSDTVFQKNMYLSLYLKGFVCERELETAQNCNILTPTLMAISVVSFLFSRAAQPEARGPNCWALAFSSASCHQRVSKTN